MGGVIGIDLGTTNTVVAAIRDGVAVALPDESGSPLIPSIVSFLPSGAVLVGSAALERRSEDVTNTVYSVKRLIGRTWDSAEVAQAKSRFPFELREGPGRATFVIARGETYTLPEISAFVLRKAKSIAELELGEPVDRAVITVPANFNDLQRAATKVAGRVAGLEVLRIINEPTAAAYAFGHTGSDAKRIAVYDFGGGTFDFTLLRLTGDVFEVLGTAGDTFLGGDDIDAEIVEQMADRFLAEGKSDPRTSAEGVARLRDAAEQLKLLLTQEPDATVRLSELGILDAPEVDFLFTRRDLDRATRAVVERTFEICRQAMSTARLANQDLDDVLLVGGSTKDPYVRRRVGEFFARPPRFDLDPHLAVALGAAEHALALTHTRGTASAIPVPPPPRPPMPSSTGAETASAEAAGRLKTQPFGRIGTDIGTGGGTAAALDTATTDLGGFESEAAALAGRRGAGTGPVGSPRREPARISVAPPEPPPSHPSPITQDLSRRERRTTGVGLGPMPQPTDVGLPLVGLENLPAVGPHAHTLTQATGLQPPFEPSKAAVSSANPLRLDATLPPSTLSGIGQPGAKPSDTDLPATKAPTAPLQPRSPIVRVSAGTREAQKSGPDLAQTLSSAIAQPLAAPAEPQPAPVRSGATDPFGAALPNPSPPVSRLGFESRPNTDPYGGANADMPAIVGPRTKPRVGPAGDEPAWADLPAGLTGRAEAAPPPVGPRPPTAAEARGPKADPPSAPRDTHADLPLVVGSPKAAPIGRTKLESKVHPPLDDVDLPVIGSAVSSRGKLDVTPGMTPGVAPADAALPERKSAPHADYTLSPEETDPYPFEPEDLPSFDAGEDDPTVVRRSRFDEEPLPSQLQFREPEADLPEPSSAGVRAEPLPRSKRPSSLNEEEIRARYGNLPLIVGGRRMGAGGAVAGGAGLGGGESKPLPSPPALEGSPAEEASPRKAPLAAPLQAPIAPAPIAPAPIAPAPIAPAPIAPAKVPTFSLEPEALEPDLAPQAIDWEEYEPPSSRPPAGRFASSRPAARQDPSLEAELPIPDVPPTSRRGAGGADVRPFSPGPPPVARVPAPLTGNAPLAVNLPLVGTQLQPNLGSTPLAPPSAQPTASAFLESPQPIPSAQAGRTSGAPTTAPMQPLPMRTAVMPVAPAAPAPVRAPQAPVAPQVPTAPFATTAIAPSTVGTFAATAALGSSPLSASAPSSRRANPALLIDVTPLSLCVETAGGYADVLVLRNTPVPCERSRDFVTVGDNQEMVIVRVGQGESSIFAENVLLGEVQLVSLPQGPRGQIRIQVSFGLDSDGILQVRALDPLTGKSAEAQLNLVGAPTSPEIQQMVARHKTKSP